MWENISLLKFNSPKCKILNVNINENPNLSYTVDGIDLNSCDNDKKKLRVITSASICKANYKCYSKGS